MSGCRGKAMFELTGKTAIITGASRGIGKGIALKFAELGANIAFLHFNDGEKADETVKELEVNPCSVKLDLIYKDGSFNESPDQTKENSITVTMKDGKAYTSSETPGYRSDNMERQTFKFTDDSGKRVVLDPENIQSIIYNGTELYNA